jgi:hypothetical protein
LSGKVGIYYEVPEKTVVYVRRVFWELAKADRDIR